MGKLPHLSEEQLQRVLDYVSAPDVESLPPGWAPGQGEQQPDQGQGPEGGAAGEYGAEDGQDYSQMPPLQEQYQDSLERGRGPQPAEPFSGMEDLREEQDGESAAGAPPPRRARVVATPAPGEPARKRARHYSSVAEMVEHLGLDEATQRRLSVIPAECLASLLTKSYDDAHNANAVVHGFIAEWLRNNRVQRQHALFQLPPQRQIADRPPQAVRVPQAQQRPVYVPAAHRRPQSTVERAEEFAALHGLDQGVLTMLVKLTPDKLQAVMDANLDTANNPSAVIVKRIVAAQQGRLHVQQQAPVEPAGVRAPAAALRVGRGFGAPGRAAVGPGQSRQWHNLPAGTISPEEYCAEWGCDGDALAALRSLQELNPIACAWITGRHLREARNVNAVLIRRVMEAREKIRAGEFG